jgi:hypothetical protein
MPTHEGRQLLTEPRICLRRRRGPQHAGRCQRSPLPPLPGWHLCSQWRQELRPVPARILPRPGTVGILQTLPSWNVHPLRRLQDCRRMCSGLRIRHLLPDRIGPLSGMPSRQLHGHSTTWRIHRLPGLPGRCSIHPPAGRSFGCHLPTQMRSRNLLRHRTGSLRCLPQSLFPNDGRQNVVRGMSRLGHDGRHGSQESRRVPAAGLQGRILP